MDTTHVFSEIAMTPLVLLLALQAPQSMVPDESNFRQWSEFIRPSARECAYTEIGWRDKFWPAVQEAKRLGRPILLWTMNGHPLGCT